MVVSTNILLLIYLIYYNMISFYSIKPLFFFVLLINFCNLQEFKGFDDTILYKINWPGKDAADRLVKVIWKLRYCIYRDINLQ